MHHFRRLALRLVVAVAMLGAGNAAHAAAVPFTATLSLRFIQTAPITVSGSGAAIVNGSSGGIHVDSLQLPANAVQGTTIQPFTDPAAYPINGFQLTVGNAAGNFTGSGGLMPLYGVAKICLFAPCAAAVANVSVPLSVVGTSMSVAVAGAINLTIAGAPWTTGTVAIGTVTAMGSRHGPASGTSSTAAASGQLQFVTPIHISTNIGSSAIIPAFATLTLHFVPEPTTMLLLGGGLSLLAAVGRHRMHSR